jgi:hypothetical protein
MNDLALTTLVDTVRDLAMLKALSILLEASKSIITIEQYMELKPLIEGMNKK